MEGGARPSVGRKKKFNNSLRHIRTSSKTEMSSRSNVEQSVGDTGSDKFPKPLKLFKEKGSEKFGLIIIVQEGHKFGTIDNDFVEGVLMQTIMVQYTEVTINN